MSQTKIAVGMIDASSIGDAKVLQGDGSWVTPSGGWSFVSLSTASGSSTVSFTTMTTGFDWLIRWANVIPGTDAQQFIAELGVAGPTYRTSNYYGAEGAVSADGSSAGGTGTAAILLTENNMGTATDEHGVGFLELIDPANASTDTFYHGMAEYHNSGSGYDNVMTGGHYTTSEAHTSIQFKFASGTVSTGFFKLYKRANA